MKSKLFVNFSRALQKYLKDKKHNSLHLAQKYARKCVSSFGSIQKRKKLEGVNGVTANTACGSKPWPIHGYRLISGIGCFRAENVLNRPQGKEYDSF